MSTIPTLSRALVKSREMASCARCGVGVGKGGHWHHRRSRSVRDEHQHCPCNGILLCTACHQWAHANPFEARAVGIIVSRYAMPAESPVWTLDYGWVMFDCHGQRLPAPNRLIEGRPA